MSATVATIQPDAFRIGSVLNRTARLMARRGLVFGLIMAAGQIPGTLVALAGLRLPAPLRIGGGFWEAAVLGGIWGLVVISVTHGLVYHASVQDIGGRPVRLGQSLAQALRALLPFMVIAIIEYIVVVFGLLLLLVPGIIWLAMFAVGLPVCVNERLGPWRSLGRSRRLTKRHRWKILALTLIVLVAYAVVGGVTFLLRGAALGVAGPYLLTLVNLVTGAAVFTFTATLYAAMYYTLREAKDGVAADRLAAVFD